MPFSSKIKSVLSDFIKIAREENKITWEEKEIPREGIREMSDKITQTSRQFFTNDPFVTLNQAF